MKGLYFYNSQFNHKYIDYQCKTDIPRTHKTGQIRALHFLKSFRVIPRRILLQARAVDGFNPYLF